MPTYEYKCDACGVEFERFQPITAAPIKRCPECGRSKVRRLIGTGAGLIFKGSGFYITDYRDKSYSDKAKAEGGGGETKAETKTESTTPQLQGDSKPTQSKPAETKSESKPDSKPAGESKPSPRKKK